MLKRGGYCYVGSSRVVLSYWRGTIVVLFVLGISPLDFVMMNFVTLWRIPLAVTL